MTDDRDICERLEDQSLDGAWFLRINAAKEIRHLRYYVARLEDDLAKAEVGLEKAQEHSSKQALDIVTLGQEVGRLRGALSSLIKLEAEYSPFAGEIYWAASHETWKRARAAIAEQKSTQEK